MQTIPLAFEPFQQGLAMIVFIYFYFQTNPCQHPIVILRDVTEADLQCILKFMYHGEVQIAEEHLKDFLKTAETLQVRGLVDGSATPVLADDTDTMNERASEEEKRLMLRRQRLMRRRTNNESNDDEAVDPTEVQNVSRIFPGHNHITVV